MPSYRISLRVSAILGLIADPVIEAIVRLEFEDGLRMGGRESSPEAAGTLVAAAPSPGSILHHPGGWLAAF